MFKIGPITLNLNDIFFKLLVFNLIHNIWYIYVVYQQNVVVDFIYFKIYGLDTRKN